METSTKTNLIKNLKVLHREELDAKNWFKAKAYANVIKEIESVDAEITCIEDLEKAKVKGIGKSIREKIIEIINTGCTERTRDVLNQSNKVDIIEDLMKVMGIGNVKAKSLVNDHGVLSIEDLEEKTKLNPSLLNDKQKMGLCYHHDFVKRIPRAEMEKHNAYLKTVIEELDPTIKWQITGSFRRGAADSGDIDVLITHPDNDKTCFHNLIMAFKKKTVPYLIDDFANGNEKYMGICKLPRHKTFRRIDIMYIDQKQFPFALLYFTGSQDFNIEMRNVALEQGWSLSEHGFKYANGPNKGSFLEKTFDSEHDIFAFLGLDYVEPVNRKKGALKK